jgi:tripartite-type tricarboxylate transporter receptor subunit TctC
VPYRDVVGPVTDLGEGRIQAYVGALAIVQPHIEAGRAKLIAITNSQRAPNHPDMPTVAEAGFPGMTFDGLVGLFGPRQMPQALRDRIAADLKEVLADQTVASRLNATGQLINPGTSAEFAASLEAQRKTLAAIAKQLGVTPQ